MNTTEREQENKKRRRVVFWLAGGLSAIIALGLIGVGADITNTSGQSASASGLNSSTVITPAVNEQTTTKPIPGSTKVVPAPKPSPGSSDIVPMTNIVPASIVVPWTPLTPSTPETVLDTRSVTTKPNTHNSNTSSTPSRRD